MARVPQWRSCLWNMSLNSLFVHIKMAKRPCLVCPVSLILERSVTFAISSQKGKAYSGEMWRGIFFLIVSKRVVQYSKSHITYCLEHYPDIWYHRDKSTTCGFNIYSIVLSLQPGEGWETMYMIEIILLNQSKLSLLGVIRQIPLTCAVSCDFVW